MESYYRQRRKCSHGHETDMRQKCYDQGERGLFCIGVYADTVVLYGLSGADLCRKVLFFAHSSDLCRGIVGRSGVNSSEGLRLFRAGFAEADRSLLEEAPRVLYLTEVTRALTDLLLRPVIGRVEDDEASSSIVATSSSCSSSSGSSTSDSLYTMSAVYFSICCLRGGPQTLMSSGNASLTRCNHSSLAP